VYNFTHGYYFFFKAYDAKSAYVLASNETATPMQHNHASSNLEAPIISFYHSAATSQEGCYNKRELM
jgi:hypothetical protein